MIRGKVYTQEKPKNAPRTFIPALSTNTRELPVTVVRAKDARLADEEIASLINAAPVAKLKFEARMGGAVYVCKIRGVAVIIDVWELSQILHNGVSRSVA